MFFEKTNSTTAKMIFWKVFYKSQYHMNNETPWKLVYHSCGCPKANSVSQTMAQSLSLDVKHLLCCKFNPMVTVMGLHR